MPEIHYKHGLTESEAERLEEAIILWKASRDKVYERDKREQFREEACSIARDVFSKEED